MSLCSCFEHEYGYAEHGRCRGTKEMEWCSCGGDETKCNFYPERRKKALGVMNTAEMWLKAQKDGKVYISKNADAVYSKKMGMVEIDDFNEQVDLGNFPDIEHLMNSEWKEMENVLTIEEAELKYGIKIIW